MIRPRVLFFKQNREFPEVHDFVTRTVRRLEVQVYSNGFAEGLGQCSQELNIWRLRQIASCSDNLHEPNGPGICSQHGPNPDLSFPATLPVAWILGTRRGDPMGEQETFSPSSAWLPPGMRVNPVVRWNYGQVWSLLRGFELPYC